MRTHLILLQERSNCRLTLIQAPVGLTAMFKQMCVTDSWTTHQGWHSLILNL